MVRVATGGDAAKRLLIFFHITDDDDFVRYTADSDVQPTIIPSIAAAEMARGFVATAPQNTSRP
jgi:hypothetical protein